MSDLLTFARKLMRINERVVATNTSSAIFGSIGDLPQAVSSRPPLRIGLFPCEAEEEENAQLAMGLWTVLAHLLERWQDIEVYRIFVRFEGEADDFVWTIDKSQFSVEDWDIEYLDENVGIWGELKQSDSGWELIATIDNDNLTGDDAEAIDLKIQAASSGDLFSKLPALAQSIAEAIDASRVDDTDPVYPDEPIEIDETFNTFLENILEWEVNLLASLWGVELDDEDIEDMFADLLDAGEALGTNFAAWAIAKAVAETMRPGYSVLGDMLIDKVPLVMTTFDSKFPMPILAGAVFKMGFAQQSYRLLAGELGIRSDNTNAWLKLAEILAEGGLWLQSIDRFQAAIEHEAVNSHLYRAYGNALISADRAGQDVETFILIDLSDYDQNYVIWEAVEAYGEALKLDSGDIRACYARVLQLSEVDIDQEYLWTDFVKLVEMDTNGDYTADVIDSLYDVEDIQTGVNALIALIESNPERQDLYTNLAALYLAGYDGDSAVPLLEKAKTMTTDTVRLAEIERLLLTANNAEFEYRFAGVISVLDAGNKLGTGDVEFLEDVVENAPHVIEAQIALGHSYYLWKEYDEALEVLLDAQEDFPDQPIVLDWLARILWESGERETAFTYLNRGIEQHPFNVQLIARAGQYLFDNGQLDEARRYLARSEEIAPGHPTLKTVREYIARQMADNPAKYQDS